MAEPSDPSALDVSEACVGGYVNGGAWTRLEFPNAGGAHVSVLPWVVRE